MSVREPRRVRGDEGQVLIVVLIFMMVFGLVVAALVANAAANLRNTATVRNQEAKVYAADSGVDWGVQTIRNDNTKCNGITPQPPLVSPPFMGQTATVTCSVVSGTSTGANGYALITTDTSSPGSFSTAGPNFQKTINGPTFSAGISDSIASVSVTNGDVFEQRVNGTCATDSDKPAGITIAPMPPYGYHCSTTTAASVAAAVPHVLPTTVPVLAPAPSNGSCTVFQPGKYTTANYKPGTDNYFVSGVYYFSNVNIDVKKMQIVGGRQAAGEQTALGLTPCASDPGGTVGTGVKWILGGTSSITVENPSGQIELYSRQGGAASEGTQGISVQTVQADDPPAWTATNPPNGPSGKPTIVQEGNGNTPAVAFHGMTYTASNTTIDLDATNGAQAWLLGGVVTGRLILRQQATIDGVRVSVDTGFGARTIILTSTVAPGTESRAVVTAVLTIANDGYRTATILSRRSSCLTSANIVCPGT